MTGFNYGNQVAASFGYSAQRLQLTSLKYTKDTTKLLDLAYSYTQNGGNNGQITKIIDNTGTAEAGRTVDYTYDELGRLQTAVTVGSTSYAKWGLSWSYDRYGNRTAQTVTHGTVTANSLSTILHSLGTPLKVAQAQLGHSRLATTFEVYTHTTTEAQREAVAKLERVLDPSWTQV